jgi:GMP synthase (glutamine-hydrolysing)
MTTPRDKLRLALLQIRNHESSQRQERQCYIERCGVSPDQLNCLNLVKNPRVAISDVQDAHAIFIGGAGDFSVTQTHPFTQPLADLADELIQQDRPIFAACWGHQFLAAHFGGEVIRDLDSAEIGTFNITLTPSGAADPLLADLPSEFPVQLGHQDRVSRLGEDWQELAFSDKCKNQIIRLRNKPVYGTQFHSEMDEARLRDRVGIYVENYLPQPDDFQAMCNTLRPSPEADQLIGRFLELYT